MPDPVWGTEGSAPEPFEQQPFEKQPFEKPPPEPVEPRQVFLDKPVVPPVAEPAAPPARRQRVEEPVPEWLQSTPYPVDVPPGRDPVAVVAVASGFVGIVFAGILFAIVTAVLGGLAGQRARESGRTFELPYLAFLLAFVDGAVWIVLHLLIDVPAWIG